MKKEEVENPLVEWRNDKWIILKTSSLLDRLFKKSMCSEWNKFGKLAY